MSNKPFWPDPNSRTSNATRLPMEVLVIIFNFVGPSTWRNPQPYLPFTWVCRFWRFVIHSDPRFETVRCMNSLTNADSEGTVCHVPKSHIVDLIVQSGRRDSQVTPYWNIHWNTLHDLKKVFSSKSYRKQIRTLYFPARQFSINVQPNFSFPKLKRLAATFSSNSSLGDQLNTRLIKLIIAASPSLQCMELPCQFLCHFHSQNLSHHLARIEWLKLEYVTSPSAIHHILEDMPNLQVLVLSMTTKMRVLYHSDWITWSNSEIQLPKLRILSLDSLNGEIWKIRVPNLDHLSVLDIVKFEHDFYGPALSGTLVDRWALTLSDWEVLKSFDFSKISTILVGVHSFMSRGIYSNPSGCPDVVCISASDHTLLDCLPFHRFHADGLNSRPLLDDYLDLPPKNCFHIPIQRHKYSGCFNYIFGRVINLVELTLHYCNIKSRSDPGYHSFLTSILDSAAGQRITRLNIMHGCSFAAACTLLGGRRVPRLERLMYYNTVLSSYPDFIPENLKMLQDSRLVAGSSPLKILELRNLSYLPPELIQEIEDLGVQLIEEPQ